jgi:hypothetical protein
MSPVNFKFLESDAQDFLKIKGVGTEVSVKKTEVKICTFYSKLT